MTDYFDEELKDLKKRILWDFKELDKIEKKVKEFEQPLVNVKETSDLVVAKIKLPGVSRENIKLKITSKELEVMAQKKKYVEVKKKGFMKSEKHNVNYYRKIALPMAINHNKAKVLFKEGLLTIVLPKK